MEKGQNVRLPWSVVILLVCGVCLFSWLGALVLRGSGSGFGRSSPQTGVNAQDVCVAGDGYVCYDGISVTCIDSDGKTRWSYLAGSNMEISASRYGVAVWNDRMLTLIDMEKGSSFYSEQQEAEVISAKVGGAYTAVLLQTEEGDRIDVKERGGSLVYTAYFDQLKVVDYGFFSGEQIMWAMALDSTGSIPTCNIMTYKPRNMRIVGDITDTEQLMYSVTFQATSVCCTGVNWYKVYDYTGTEIEDLRRLVYGWYLFSSDECDDPLMAYVPNGQTEGTVQIRDVRMLRSDLDRKVHFPYDCISVVARGDHVYGFSADGYLMRASTDRDSVDAWQMPFYIDRVYGITSDLKAVVGSGNTVYLVSLND